MANAADYNELCNNRITHVHVRVQLRARQQLLLL